MEESRWYKKEKGDKVWWYYNNDTTIGEFIFSFDKKETFNLFADYPWKLTAEQKAIFDKENPFWADFFKERG